MGFSDQDPRFTPNLGTGGAPMGGPRYHFDPTLASSRKFPAFYDDKWFIAEWNNGWIKTADLNASGAMTGVQNFALRHRLPAPDGPRLRPRRRALRDRVGLGLQRQQRRLRRLPGRLPQGRPEPGRAGRRHADRGPRAAERQLLQRRLGRPRGHRRSRTRGTSATAPTSTAANPTHTFAANGTYQVKLTVTDAGGLTGVSNTVVTVGNRTPTVTIEFPENGQIASFTDKIPYRISVTDPEDGIDRLRHLLQPTSSSRSARP